VLFKNKNALKYL